MSQIPLSNFASWIAEICTQFKSLSHLLYLSENSHQLKVLQEESIQSIENLLIALHQQDSFCIESGLLLTCLMHHYFPKHIKNPDNANVNIDKECELVWQLAHSTLEMCSYYDYSQFKLDSKKANLNFEKLSNHFIQYYKFFNSNAPQGDSTFKITSVSSMVGLFGKSLTDGNSLKLTNDLIDLNEKVTFKTVDQVIRKPLPSIPFSSNCNSQHSVNQINSIRNEEIQQNLTTIIQQEEEKPELNIGSKGFVFIEKEDSNDYYYKFKF